MDRRLGIGFVQDGENQKKRRAAPIHSGRPEPVVFVGNAAEVDVDGDADCAVSLTLIRAKGAGEYRPKSVALHHDLPAVKVSEKTLREGVTLVVDEALKLELESAIEELREER